MVRFRKLRGDKEQTDAADLPEATDGAEGGTEELLSGDGEVEIPAEDEAAEATSDTDGGTDDPAGEEVSNDASSEAIDEEAGDLLGLDDDTSTAEQGAPVQATDDGEPSGALKELAARMAVIQSHLETVQGTREEMEGKLQAMEERMLRLGNLAEAVSSDYNPFIAENTPRSPSWDEAAPPDPEDSTDHGEPTPAQADGAPREPVPAPSAEPQEPSEPAEVPSVSEAPEPPEAPEVPEAPTDMSEALEALKAGAQADQGASPLTPSTDGSPRGAPGPEGSDTGDPMEAMREFGKSLSPKMEERLGSLEENFLLLEWVGLMLRRVGRANLLDLLEYYEGLGWLDTGTKRRVVRVAVGLDAPDTTGSDQWRGDVDLHERSLVTIERLHGRDVTSADIEGLRMDMRRFFGE